MSTNPQEEVYKEYLNYDWNSFSDFQDGVKQILDNYLDNLKESNPSTISIPALDQQQLIEQAKSFYYCSHTGNILNIDDYTQWKLHNGDKYDKNKKITEIEEDVKPSEEPEATTDNASSDPPYSSNYQELVELIVSGKPVPGIKHIPDTVLSDQSSTSKASQRVKPWEKNNTSTTTTSETLN
ncbi:hypothetical protein DFJ63DRAFT_333816 [Scheffersomyces coipomensis]|uniref:uncharacterized protein n=1 Tax=Scheffersomyces coipomensis TaxID=1788519 RepID=UPI00315E023C